jgi:hypothetical protein
MDLAITRPQLEAIERAEHLPDVLRTVLQRAAPAANGGGVVLHLTYEEATALQELCAWSVRLDAAGAVTADSQIYEDLVRAILTHPDY